MRWPWPIAKANFKKERRAAPWVLSHKPVRKTILNASVSLPHGGRRSFKIGPRNWGCSESNRGEWHSPCNLFDNETPCIQLLKSAAESSALTAAQKTALRLTRLHLASQDICVDEYKPTLRVQCDAHPSGRTMVLGLLRRTARC